MRVVTQLVRMEFKLGSIKRDGDNLLILSDPKQSMPTKVYMGADDAVDMILSGLNWSTISFVLSLPFLYFKTRKENRSGR